MWKKLRILLLLSVLLFVALAAYESRQNLLDWDNAKWVVIHPIDADGSAAAQALIENLSEEDFQEIGRFIEAQARDHGLVRDRLVQIRLGPVIKELPPQIARGSGTLERLIWSLRLRYWAYRVRKDYAAPPADIRIFVQYYDPRVHKTLDHSLGISKLSLAVVKAFAAPHMTPANNVVIAHELLHVFGASDKYDPRTNLPLYPAGYADPDASPLYPQVRAEIMGGRIPLGETRAVEPDGLEQAMIGAATARELRWVD